MKKPETPIRGNNLLQARPLRRSVRGSPAARRDSRRPLCRAAATSMAVDRRWALDLVVQRWGRLPCGEPHRARAPRPSAPRQRLSAAQELSSMAVGSGEWGSGERGQQAGGRGSSGGQGPIPPGSRRPTINP